MSSAVAIALVLLPLAAFAAETPAPADVARDHFARAARDYGARDFDAAARESMAAWEADAEPEYLFAWAQAERMRGRCDAAVPIYDRLLAMTLGDGERDAARRSRALCPAPSVIEPRPPAAPPVSAPPPPPARAAAAPPAAPSRWYRDKLGGVLFGAGVALVGVGAGFGGQALVDGRAATAATAYRRFQEEAGAAHRDGAVALTGLAAGAGLALAGVIRLVVHARHAR